MINYYENELKGKIKLFLETYKKNSNLRNQNIINLSNEILLFIYYYLSKNQILLLSNYFNETLVSNLILSLSLKISDKTINIEDQRIYDIYSSLIDVLYEYIQDNIIKEKEILSIIFQNETCSYIHFLYLNNISHSSNEIGYINYKICFHIIKKEVLKNKPNHSFISRLKKIFIDLINKRNNNIPSIKLKNQLIDEFNFSWNYFFNNFHQFNCENSFLNEINDHCHRNNNSSSSSIRRISTRLESINIQSSSSKVHSYEKIISGYDISLNSLPIRNLNYDFVDIEIKDSLLKKKRNININICMNKSEINLIKSILRHSQNQEIELLYSKRSDSYLTRLSKYAYFENLSKDTILTKEDLLFKQVIILKNTKMNTIKQNDTKENEDQIRISNDKSKNKIKFKLQISYIEFKKDDLPCRIKEEIEFYKEFS